MPSVLSYARKAAFLLASLSIIIAGFAAPCRAAEAQAKPVAIEVQQLALMPFLLGSTEAQKKDKKLEKVNKVLQKK